MSKTRPGSITTALEPDEGLFGAFGSEGQILVSKVKDKQPCTTRSYQASAFSHSQNQKDSGNLLPLKSSARLSGKDWFLMFLLKRWEKGRKHKGTTLSLCFLKHILRNPRRPTQKQRWGNFLSICQVAEYFQMTANSEPYRVQAFSAGGWRLQRAQFEVWALSRLTIPTRDWLWVRN